MTVTAPPRPPRPSDPVDRQEVEALVDRQEVEALVEALIEEARQRARRRRRIRMAVAACVALVGVTVFAVFERTAELQSSSPALAAGSNLTAGKVKIVIAGTNDEYPVTDGSLSGKGTFRASGAITDAGTALGYRTVRAELITLRFVTKGKNGTITYVVKIDMTTGTSRWTIASGTKAYKGLHGKGTESENASYTVSTLRGTVSR
jgi:hypothetical protein